MDSKLYSLTFEPVYKDYIWGGTRIPELYEKPPANGICAESWEVSVRPEGMSVVSDGPLAGTTLGDLVAEYGDRLVGTDAQDGTFPLLIKLIDADKALSVQVHPNDESAPKVGGEAKTEMWYVLDATSEACVYAGVEEGVTREEFERALADEELETVLRRWNVRAGDAIFIPGGRVHAIGAGCLLLEVQQSSNTTYRVYDWGRVGKDGKPRDLHIEQALQVIKLRDAAPTLVDSSEAGCEIVRSPYFVVERMSVERQTKQTLDGRSFHVIFCVEGCVSVATGGHSRRIAAGNSCLIPACLGAYTLESQDSSARLVRIRLPESRS